MDLVERQVTVMEYVGHVAVDRLVDRSPRMPDLPEVRVPAQRQPGGPGRLGRFVLRRFGIDTSSAPTAPTPPQANRPGHIENAIAQVHHRRTKRIYTRIARLTDDRTRSKDHAAVTGEDRGVQTKQLRGFRADVRAIRRAFHLGPWDTRRGSDGSVISKGYAGRPNHMPKITYGAPPQTSQEVAAGSATGVAVPEQRPLSRRRRRNSIATVDLRARLRQESHRLRSEATIALTGDEVGQAVKDYLRLRLQSAATRVRSRVAVANPERANGRIRTSLRSLMESYASEPDPARRGRIGRILTSDFATAFLTRSDAAIAYPRATSGADIQLMQRLHMPAGFSHRAASARVIESGFRTPERIYSVIDVVNVLGTVASAGYNAWQNRGGSDSGPDTGSPAPAPTPPYGHPTSPGA